VTGLLDRVGEKLDQECLVRRGGLKKKGCEVVMTGAPKHRLIVDFDKPGSPLANKTRCDFLLIAEACPGSHWVVVLELKKGKLQVGEVVKQLQAGACAAEGVVPRREAVKFRPVAVSGRFWKHDRKKLRESKSMIRFHEQKEHIRRIWCGSELTAVLD